MSPVSTVEFLLWLLIAASLIAVVATRVGIPYTVALVIGGLAIGSVRLPIIQEIYQSHGATWLTPEVILILFLPPLLFEGSLTINARYLFKNLIPILLYANVGVLAATFVTGYALHFAVGLPLAVALLFGAIISATDPISVLAIFKDLAVPNRLSLLVQGESLLNDGTAVVLFQILLTVVITQKMSIAAGIGEFLQSVLGGAIVGFSLGYVASEFTKRIDDPQVEITLTAILAYSSYLIAGYLHLSGVIATVVAGVTLGNLGTKTGMSARTRLALWSFWEYTSFVINSLVFLLIGMEVRIGELFHSWSSTLLAIVAVLLGRVLAIYGLTPLSNLLTEKISLRWQHVLVWGGLHGSLSLALALSLGSNFPYRQQILTLTFGVVSVSIIAQGLTVKPLLSLLGIATRREDDFAVARVRQIALSTARSELDQMWKSSAISGPAYQSLRDSLDREVKSVKEEVAGLYAKDKDHVDEELRDVKLRLLAAERSAISRAVHDGVITAHAATKLIDAADRAMDDLMGKAVKAREDS